MLGNIGMPEILLILLVVLLLFGAKRIPEIAGGLGKGINEFKRNMSDAQRAISEPSRSESPQLGAERTTEPVVTRDEANAAPEPKRLLQ